MLVSGRQVVACRKLAVAGAVGQRRRAHDLGIKRIADVRILDNQAPLDSREVLRRRIDRLNEARRFRSEQ